ncbi:acyl-phosphate glycerol 3-phosphate acyltransferase [Planococcus glaciei]|uniref:lysophospholipid acyltransferase family protein n=1 Tax=Planococcus glaciei TaxID=459472 RepID=UPI00069F3DDD|nr:lysophospholipid acyltransferase family protein [Planococcus glaciei]KOF12041.1 acyl-phosphate glycerol 3-phosphate acyltransferase [Planococcus glaciei]MBX0314527.1 lysophospholipid acyltransferase family protein [Planococcus glaciei]
MIKAKKMPLFENAFELYLNPLIRRSFANVFGRDIVQPPSQPVLFIANHSSWWDGLLFFFLNRSVWRHDVHMMMDEKGLKRYGFFRYLGAFSINRSKPKDILASLQYAEQLLLSGKTVILFPQGEEFHQEIRPLGFSTGIAYLMEHCPDVPAIPVSFYYSFRHERKPEVWVQQGNPFYYKEIRGSARKEKTGSIEQAITEQLDQLKSEVVSENTAAFRKFTGRRK